MFRATDFFCCRHCHSDCIALYYADGYTHKWESPLSSNFKKLFFRKRSISYDDNFKAQTKKNTATLIIWLRCIRRFYRATCSDISSYMKTKSSENNFSSSRVPFFRIAFLVHSSQTKDKTVWMQQTKEMREMERARKRFKFLWSIQFVILWCRAHFWCGFPHFVIYCVVFFLLFLCSVLFCIHTSLPLSHSLSTDTCRGIIWIDRKIWQILVPLMCSVFLCIILSLLLITFHVSDDRLVSDWNIASRIGVWLNILAFLLQIFIELFKIQQFLANY